MAPTILPAASIASSRASLELPIAINPTLWPELLEQAAAALAGRIKFDREMLPLELLAIAAEMREVAA